MDRVPESNKISVRVPEFSGREEGDPYPNRKLSGIRYRVPDNFGSGYWVTFFLGFFLPNNFVV